MRGFISSILVLCVSQSLGENYDSGFRATFNLDRFEFGKKGFYDLPRTVDKAVSAKWNKVQPPNGSIPQLELYCYKDNLKFCIWYDDLGHAAGAQIALPEDEVEKAVFGFEELGYTKWPVSIQGDEKSYWALSYYFVSKETLQEPNEIRLKKRAQNATLVNGAIWLTGNDGQLIKFTDGETASNTSEFVKQGCIPWMGHHYFRNLTKQTPCAAKTFPSWCPLVIDNKTVGLGYVFVGQLPEKSGERNWFETLLGLASRISVPRGPEWVYELGLSPGFLTIHMYFVKNPFSILCPTNN